MLAHQVRLMLQVATYGLGTPSSPEDCMRCVLQCHFCGDDLPCLVAVLKLQREQQLKQREQEEEL